MKDSDLVKLIMKLDEHCKENICTKRYRLYSDKGCMFRYCNFHEIISKLVGNTCLGEIWLRFDTVALADDFVKQLEERTADFPYYKIMIYISNDNAVKRIQDYVFSKEEALEYQKTHEDSVRIKHKGEAK